MEEGAGFEQQVLEVLKSFGERLGALELQSWSQLRDVAVLFSQVGRPAEGVPCAERALELAPADQQQAIQDLIATLQAQASQ